MNLGVDTDKGNHKMIKGSEIGFVHEKIGHNLYEKRIFFLLSMFSLKKCVLGHWQSEIIQVTDNASLMDGFLSVVIYQ